MKYLQQSSTIQSKICRTSALSEAFFEIVYFNSTGFQFNLNPTGTYRSNKWFKCLRQRCSSKKKYFPNGKIHSQEPRYWDFRINFTNE